MLSAHLLTSRSGVQHHKSRTLEPKWGETKYCLVQEPSTQNLRVQVDDYDIVNLEVRCRFPAELLQLLQLTA